MMGDENELIGDRVRVDITGVFGVSEKMIMEKGWLIGNMYFKHKFN